MWFKISDLTLKILPHFSEPYWTNIRIYAFTSQHWFMYEISVQRIKTKQRCEFSVNFKTKKNLFLVNWYRFPVGDVFFFFIGDDKRFWVFVLAAISIRIFIELAFVAF